MHFLTGGYSCWCSLGVAVGVTGAVRAPHHSASGGGGSLVVLAESAVLSRCIILSTMCHIPNFGPTWLLVSHKKRLLLSSSFLFSTSHRYYHLPLSPFPRFISLSSSLVFSRWTVLTQTDPINPTSDLSLSTEAHRKEQMCFFIYIHTQCQWTEVFIFLISCDRPSLQCKGKNDPCQIKWQTDRMTFPEVKCFILLFFVCLFSTSHLALFSDNVH